MELVWPAAEHLPEYVRALEAGWSPNTLSPQAALEELALIKEDPELFLALQIDREAKGPPIVLPDGSTVPRLPGYKRWMWDGEFCGSIGFRWQPKTHELPPTCLGHIGYTVVSWKRRRGYATRALQMLIGEIDEEGLLYVDITTDTTNLGSRKVIEANGGQLVEPFRKAAIYGGEESLLYRIYLPERLR
jgi:predicted acetyltransferase